MLKKLYDINLGNPVKMGLENSNALYKLLGDPLSNIPIIHVTGTNGKGSVTLKLSECFRHHNLRTGLFISPHISSFRERIQVDTEKISEEEFMVCVYSTIINKGSITFIYVFIYAFIQSLNFCL